MSALFLKLAILLCAFPVSCSSMKVFVLDAEGIKVPVIGQEDETILYPCHDKDGNFVMEGQDECIQMFGDGVLGDVVSEDMATIENERMSSMEDDPANEDAKLREKQDEQETAPSTSTSFTVDTSVDEPLEPLAFARGDSLALPGDIYQPQKVWGYVLVMFVLLACCASVVILWYFALYKKKQQKRRLQRAVGWARSEGWIMEQNINDRAPEQNISWATYGPEMV